MTPAAATALMALRESGQVPRNMEEASRSKNSGAASNAANGATINATSLQLLAAYEIDFWGKYRNATAAAREELLASEASREALRLSLASSVAQSWYAYQAFTQRVELTERTLVAQEKTLSLQKRRVDVGLIGEFELRQFEADVATTRSVLPGLILAREQQRNALGILLGRSPKALVEGKLTMARDGAFVAPTGADEAVPEALPSSRLLARPDVRAAEAALRAANARIGVARAAWFPSISLTASGGVASGALSGLFDAGSGAFNVAGSLLQPLLLSGRIAAGVDASLAAREAAVASYRQTVANAFRDTLDALAVRRAAQAQVSAEAARVDALRETLRLARLRYDNGLISQLEVLDAERGLLAAEGGLIEARRAQAVSLIQVWTAIGG
jgi:multidrug efflux system outer membrane protein